MEWSGAADSGANGSGVWGDSPDDGRGMSTRSNGDFESKLIASAASSISPFAHLWHAASQKCVRMKDQARDAYSISV